MKEKKRKNDEDRLLLDRYQEKIRYIVDDRKLEELWDWEDVLKRFKFGLPKESGIPDLDATEVFVKAEKCLSKRPEYQMSYPESMIAIKKLGKPAAKKENMQERELLLRTAKEMAHILSAHPESDVFLRAECKEDEWENLTMNFCVGSGSLSEKTLASMIRGAYGQASYEPVDFRYEDDWITCYAKAKTIVKNKKIFDKDINERKYESWISTLLSSLSCSRSYSVDIILHPLISSEEKEELNALIVSMVDVYKEIAFHQEIGWNNSVTGGGNLTIRYSKLHNLMQNLRYLRNATQDGIEAGENYSFTYAENSKIRDQYAARLMEELEYKLTCFRRIQNSVGWAVTIKASAKDEETMDAITSLISGAAEHANISLKWTLEPNCAMYASNQEILPFLTFPTREFSDFEFVENEEFSLISPATEKDGLYIGNVLWNGEKVSRFYVPEQVLNRHAFICGMTGSGKTNTLFKLMEEIKVPFLVIEPVKGEYRSLCNKYSDTTIWTMRTSDVVSEQVKILQINPFWFPEGANLAFHIDSIKTIISSAFELSAAMPNIVEQCLYNVYLKSGWNIVTNKNIYKDILPEEYLYPTFTDLTNEVAAYLDKSDFGEEVLGNYKGALLSRLKSFTNGVKGVLLNTSRHPDYESFMFGRNVIELEGLADDADKCLVMGTILVQYYQYLKGHFEDKDKKNTLRHILVIEESHRLFKNVKSQNKSSEGADPTGQLVESLSNIMAEIRAFGEGMLIVDQSPSKIAEDVIKNSGTKLIHRIDNEADIKLLQSAMLLPDNVVGFAALSQGEALIRSDRMLRPCKVKVLCSDVKERYSLADTFKTGDIQDYEMNDIFVANTILQDEEIAKKIQEEIETLLRSFVWMDWKQWYEVFDQFLLQIVMILQQHFMLERLENRLNTVVEMISIMLFKMYNDRGKKNVSLLHMFVLRMFAFFIDERNKCKVKFAAIEMMHEYFDAELCKQVLYTNINWLLDKVEYQEFTKDLELELDSVKAYFLWGYLGKTWNKMLEEKEACEIHEGFTVEAFLEINTYLNVSNCIGWSQELEEKVKKVMQKKLQKSKEFDMSQKE